VERVYEEAFSEVDEIIKLMPIDISSKIPQKFRQVISENPLFPPMFLFYNSILTSFAISTSLVNSISFFFSSY